MKIIWSPRALDKASEIADYISEDSPKEAKKWLHKLFKEVERLKTFPESARVVPELNNQKVREIIFKNFRIIYEIQEDLVSILTIRRFRQELNINEL